MAYQGRGPGAPYGDYDLYSQTPAPNRAPVLLAPEPQRIQPEMSNQIAGGIDKLSLNAQSPRLSYADLSGADEEPYLSPFPKLVNPPPNVPPSYAELETTLENARTVVLNSNDPEMQLAWAADALVYVGVCRDNEERMAASKPNSARPATPRIENQLKTDAMNVVKFLAEQHHPKAEFLRGLYLEWGRFGEREDKKEAFRCYSRAADRGYARAEYRIGMLYESYNDSIKALRHYKRGVAAGDAASCYRLGMMTIRGQCGQAQDYREGINLIQKSAEAADENAAQGAYVYGMFLCGGLPQLSIPVEVLPLDERAARTNLEKAAYLSFSKAQLKMGSAYELADIGCEFNPSLSIHYYALAATQGEVEAQMALSKWFLVGSEGILPKNEELAYKYAEQAAAGGLAIGEFAVAYFNEVGICVPKDLDKAKEWYRKASSHGNEDATKRLAAVKQKSVLSRKDHEEMAVHRIKSQHGSVRGARPDRFRGQQLPPARGTTPYPEQDLPIQRPPTVTPYPLEDGPPRQPVPRASSATFYNAQHQPPSRPATTVGPDGRPSSAFQISPDLRSNSSMSNPSPQYPPNRGGAPQSVRPINAQNYNSGPPPGVRPYPPGNRVVSGPPATSTNMRPQQPFQQSPKPPPMPQKIPYNAINNNNAYGSPRPPPAQSPALRPTDSMPNFDRPPAGRMSTPVSRPGSRPPEGRKPVSSVPPLPQKTPVPTPVATPKPNTGTSTAPPPGAKPPRGPKTFDEMGVPSGKGDSECSVM